MRQQNFEFGEIDGNVVKIDGVAVLVARAGKNRRAGMEHDRDFVGFGGAVDDFEFFDAVQIIVRETAIDAVDGF